MAVNDVSVTRAKTPHNSDCIPAGGQHNTNECWATGATTGCLDLWLSPPPPHPPRHLALSSPRLSARCSDWPRQAHLWETVPRGREAIPELEEVMLRWCATFTVNLVLSFWCWKVTVLCSVNVYAFFLLVFLGEAALSGGMIGDCWWKSCGSRERSAWTCYKCYNGWFVHDLHAFLS